MRKALILLYVVTMISSLFCSYSYSAGLSKISEEDLRKVIEEFVHRKTDHLGANVKIKNILITGQTAVPPGDLEYEVKAPNNWEGLGSVSLAIIVRVDGKLRKNIPVKVEVEALVDMVVTTRQLETGEIVGESDVIMQQRDIATTGRKFYKNFADVVGKRIKTPVRNNFALRSDQLDKPPLIKSGQLVMIILENSLMRVTATGRSKGAGAAGENVVVQNLVSQKDIFARVVDTSTVRVEF